MNHLPWFRLYSEAVDDPKLRLLAFEDRWHFVAILCCKSQGILDSNSKLIDRQIAVKLGVQLRELDEIKRRLQEVQLIGANWQPLQWCKRQFKSDISTERVKKHREKHTLTNCNGNVTFQKRKSNALDTDTDTEKTCANRDAFALFWDQYPNKKNKKKAEVAFNRLTANKQNRATEDSKRRYVGVEKRYIPLPTTYIHGERWDDENDEDKKTTKEFVR